MLHGGAERVGAAAGNAQFCREPIYLIDYASVFAGTSVN